MLTARPATPLDAAFLLQLRNDPETVAASRVRQSVSLDEHTAWLARILDDPTRRLRVVSDAVWIATNSFGASVGTYRLDGVGSAEIEVSLTVAPEHRHSGHGYARRIIELACREAVGYGPETLVAEIRRENIPSFVAFFRNGFMIEGWAGDVFDGILRLDVDAEDVIRRACPSCFARVPHHTNAARSIGGGDRHPVRDIHAVEDAGGVGLQECEAGDLWLAWEGARERRLSGAAAPTERGTNGSTAAAEPRVRDNLGIAGLFAGSSPAASTNPESLKEEVP